MNRLLETLKANRVRLYKCTVSAGVIFYAYAVGLYMIPDNPSRSRLLAPLRALICYTGLWQSYVVFSPNPRPTNLDISAEIRYDDGSVSVWRYPRMDQMSQLERLQKERYRKYGMEHLNNDKEALLRPDFARYLARLHKSDARQPVEIKLVRNWANIPPPQQGLGRPLPPHLNHYAFYTYSVKKSDLS